MALVILPASLFPLLTAASSTALFEGLLGIAYFGFLSFQAKLTWNFSKRLHSAEATLRTERDYFLTTLDILPAMISFLDSDLRYIFSNEVLKNYFAGTNARKAHVLGFRNPQNPWVQKVKSLIESTDQSQSFQFEISIKGESRWHAISMVKSHGDPQGCAIVAVDINAEKIAELRSIHTAKLLALGEISADIAHEINTPLAVISGKAGLLRRLLATTPLDLVKLEREVDAIQRSSGRIESIVRGLKQLSRDDLADPMVEADIGGIINEAIELQMGRIRKVNVDVVAPVVTASVQVRPTQLFQVLTNLLGNALDASENVKNPQIKFEIERHVGSVFLRIMDNGTGIPKDLEDRVFNSFFTTKSVGKGTGLGLSVSKRIIETHGGKLRLNRSIPGTCFEIILP